jgi:2-keto-4-pentenoate hydratase/2-oxohepta-3-ene-1,7-dioic acid hydratase in catechol pathway
MNDHVLDLVRVRPASMTFLPSVSRNTTQNIGMRWLRYTVGGRTTYGLLEGQLVEETLGGPLDRYERTGRYRSLSSVKIEVPIFPKTFYAAGLNYDSHVKSTAAFTGRKLDIPRKPDIGYRAVNALIAHDEPIVIPKSATEKVQYEGELVVVIGKKAKSLSESEALTCVLGYTIGNDVSERSWQEDDRTLWRSKNTDTFKPMGPWIETDVELNDMQTTVRVNGTTMVRFRTNDMVFGIARYISTMSQYLTLYPGDVIWMGTDGTSANIKHGDVVEIEITGIGTLRNPVVLEK